MDERDKAYTAIIQKEITPMPGLFQFTNLLKKEKYKLAVVSSSNKLHLKIKLKKLASCSQKQSF